VTARNPPELASSGVATDEAMVSGLAPATGVTEMVGNSTCGSGDTGGSR